MELNERQQEKLSTCMDSCCNVTYPTLEIIEESGEYVEKILKHIDWMPDFKEQVQLESLMQAFVDIAKRIGKYGKLTRHTGEAPFRFNFANADTEDLLAIRKELGDIEWGTDVADFFLCHGDINKKENICLYPATAQARNNMNAIKLKVRKADDTIDGQGDDTRTTF